MGWDKIREDEGWQQAQYEENKKKYKWWCFFINEAKLYFAGDSLLGLAKNNRLDNFLNIDGFVSEW